MQTLRPFDGRWLSWMHRDMLNGVFRVKRAKWLLEPPDLKGWDNWTGTEQLTEEIGLALELLDEQMPGVWMGWSLKRGDLTNGIAFRIV